MRIAAMMAAMAFMSAPAWATVVLITSSKSIGPLQTTITASAPGSPAIPLEEAEIIVRGTTLLINGRHTIKSITVERSTSNNPGVVSHASNQTFDYGGGDVVVGMELTVIDSMSIQGAAGSLVASSFDLTGRGYPREQGPGAGVTDYYASGGSHAGRGGEGNFEHHSNCYGDFAQPTTFGSGGGTGHGSLGNAGGGRARVVVMGTLSNDGVMSADGAGGGVLSSGGGAGGSLWISCNHLAGGGQFRADGGDVGNGGGGGGGGRISIDYTTTSFTGSARAWGGGTTYYGGAGTVCWRVQDETPTLIIDNNDMADNFAWAVAESTDIPMPGIINANVTIGSAAVMTNRRLDPGTPLHFMGNVNVASEGAIHADGLGHTYADVGPGNGSNGTTTGGGGGHGGSGGVGEPGTVAGGGTYGDEMHPATKGSAGGNGGTNIGGFGGGAMKLVVDGTLTVDGRVSANGLLSGGRAGGGAGGSLWINAGGIAGSGVISADGGEALVVTNRGGGGGGGRVAIYTCNLSLDGANITADGGEGYQNGAAGTVYFGATSDYDGSGFVDIEDYSAFVLDFEAGLEAADFDGSGFVDVEDFSAFVAAFEAGC